jgi:urease accessory protein
MPDCTFIDPIADASWHARLSLGFARDGGCTRLVRRVHRGPLRVQKALYPEGPDTCHVIVVHPPGGIVGGDRLDIALDAPAGCRVLATSPGAAKWYRANGRASRQDVRLAAGPGAAIEWLPQETIVYDDADVSMAHDVDLAPGAVYIGTEVLCFGRRASGERFTRGQVRQRTCIRIDGRPVWWEQGAITPASLASPLGLRGHSVWASLVAVGKPVPAALQNALRALDAGLAVSQVKHAFVARFVGDDSERARALLSAVWQALRPHLLDRTAVPPRIWNT